MSLRLKYLAKVSAVIPFGAFGVSVLLGAALPEAASAASRAAPDQASDVGVADRLADVREAVFVAIAPQSAITPADPNIQLAWGNRWNNWGWGGRPGWGGRWNNFRPRWNNWRNSWRNW